MKRNSKARLVELELPSVPLPITKIDISELISFTEEQFGEPDISQFGEIISEIIMKLNLYGLNEEWIEKDKRDMYFWLHNLQRCFNKSRMVVTLP